MPYAFHSGEVRCWCGADLCEAASMKAFTDLGNRDLEIGSCHLDRGLDVVFDAGHPVTCSEDIVDFRCSKCSEVLEIFSHEVSGYV